MTGSGVQPLHGVACQARNTTPDATSGPLRRVGRYSRVGKRQADNRGLTGPYNAPVESQAEKAGEKLK